MIHQGGEKDGKKETNGELKKGSGVVRVATKCINKTVLCFVHANVHMMEGKRMFRFHRMLDCPNGNTPPPTITTKHSTVKTHAHTHTPPNESVWMSTIAFGLTIATT